MIRRALIGGLAAALVLIALRAGAMTAAEHASHHPGGGAAAAPGAPGMAPGAPMGAHPRAAQRAGRARDGRRRYGRARDDGQNDDAGQPRRRGTGGADSSIGIGVAVSSGTKCRGRNGRHDGAGVVRRLRGRRLRVCWRSQDSDLFLTDDASCAYPGKTRRDRCARESANQRGHVVNRDRLRVAQARDTSRRQGGHGASIGMMREGLDELGAGIAARPVLLEGKAPRNLALDWFKRQMNLASPVQPEEPRLVLGVTPFHLFTMVLLIAFALAMLALYFFKMRRAAALFGRLGPDTKAPPPGSSPPLAGAPSSPSPAPPEKAPAPAAPTSPATPAAGTPAATDPSPAGSSAVPASDGDAAKAANKPSAPPVAGSSPVSLVTMPAASPATKNWRGQLRVGSIVTETPSVKTFRLVPTSNDSFLPFTFVPGQFLNVSFWIGGARMNRSYSISSSPTPHEYVELTERREPRGAVSRHIDDLLKVGDLIEAGGPVGKFTFTGTEADSIVLIAGGVGITPMMSITRYLTERS